MDRPRDSRRNRVYVAEIRTRKQASEGRIFNTEKENQRYVDKVCEDLDTAPISVQWSKRAKVMSTANPSERKIAIAFKLPTHRTEMVTLHEIAHILQSPFSAYHGIEFIRIYLQLVYRYIGAKTAKTLIANLDATKAL